MAGDTDTLQDEERDDSPQTAEEEAPAIVTGDSPAAIDSESVPRETAAAPAIMSAASGPLPGAGFRRPEAAMAVPEAEQPPAIAPPARAINPAVAPVAPAGARAPLNPNSIAAQNPFNVLLAKEENIHNPFARVLAKVATHVGKGLETFAPDYDKTVEERQHAAEVPSIVAERQAQTADIQEQQKERAAEAQRKASGQLPIKDPTPIYFGNEVAGQEGRDEYGNYHRYMNPGYEDVSLPAGPAAAGAPGSGGGGAPAPAGPQTPPAGAAPQGNAVAGPQTAAPARVGTTQKPQEPQRAPLPTPAEAAKLAPVGTAADTYNKQIKDILGSEAGNYAISPTTSHEDAEKILADARARKNEIDKDKSLDRATNAPEAAQARKDAHTMGYAVDKDGKLSYMSKADADKLHSTFEEVKAGDVNKDRQAIRQLNDVQQNVSRYRMAQNAIKADIPKTSASAMAAILSDKEIGAKVEPFGVGLNLGQLNDVFKGTEKAHLWNSLSQPERELVTSYLRAKSSVIAYQKALTGIGRTNKEQLDIEMEQLPVPYVGATIANGQLDAFQENIDRATEGFPVNLPGLKSPAQTRAENEKPKAFKVPEGAPPAKGVPDGKVLKQNGQVVAVSKGGAWVAP